ncbi:MAG: LCP family protein, partial [Hyphomicrobiales bacterium]
FVILAVGIDSRPDTTDGLTTLNTDTIMLANIDPVAKTVKVLSIPRDLLIDIRTRDGTYSDRINASFAAGVRNGGGVDEGMAQLEGDIERNFDVDIDYWVQVDFRGAEELLDAIGGVDVTIPEDLAIERWWYSDDDINGRWLSFPPGPQHLDGYEAVAFARLREFDDDFHRIRRQQLVLQAAMLRATEGGLLDHPLDAWDAYSHAIGTNVPAGRVPGYALLVKQLDGRISTYSLADPVDGVPTMTGVRLRNGAAVLTARPENVEYWFDVVFGPDEGEGPADLREGQAAVPDTLP